MRNKNTLFLYIHEIGQTNYKYQKLLNTSARKKGLEEKKFFMCDWNFEKLHLSGLAVMS